MIAAFFRNIPRPSDWRWQVGIDIVFATALLGAAGIPLILLRYTTLINSNKLMYGLLAAWLLLGAVWHIIGAGFNTRQSPTTTPPKSLLTTTLIVSLGLFLFCWLAYGLPMRRYFWIGMDEASFFTDQAFWLPFYDQIASRPLAGMEFFLAFRVLTPNNLEGLLWMTFIQHFLTAVLLYRIMCILLPRLSVLALVAAVLYIVNPAEPSRYLIFMSPYYGAVFSLMLAFFLMLISYKHQARWLLAAACVSLGASLLHYEAGYFPALLAFPLMFFLGRRAHFWSWSYAWLGTLGLMALRFIQFYQASDSTYQSGYVATAVSRGNSITTVFNNLLIQVKPVLNYFLTADALPQYGVYGLIVFALIVIPLWWLVKRSSSDLPRRVYVIGIIFTLIAIVLSVAAWLPLPSLPLRNWQENPTFRIHHYSSVAHGVFWALMLGFIGSWLAPHLRRIWIIGATGLMVVLAVAAGFQQQDRKVLFNPGATLEKTASIFQQVHQLMPVPPENGVIFFALEDEQLSPMGWGFSVYDSSCALFGIPAYQGSYSAETGWQARAITNYPPPDAPDYVPYNFNDRTVFAFSVTFEGDVTRIEVPADIHTPPDALPPAPCFRSQLDVAPDQPLPFFADWAN
jgi:hypothetical protein